MAKARLKKTENSNKIDVPVEMIENGDIEEQTLESVKSSDIKEIPVETAENDVTEELKEDMQTNVSINVDAVKQKEIPKKNEKLVRVKLKRKHKMIVGATWYYFKQDEVVTVPENVKDILLKTDLLLPI